MFFVVAFIEKYYICNQKTKKNKNMAKHVTIKDIARSLCISVSTVSRALTDAGTYAKRRETWWWRRRSDSVTSVIL